MMFFVTILNMEQFRFNYGRKASQTRLKKLEINLPVDSEGKIDFDFITSFIKSCKYSKNIFNL